MTRPPAPDLPRQDDSDLALLDHCLAGDDAAWYVLFERYQPLLLAAARQLLGRTTCCAVLEDVAATVWCSLAEADKRVLRAFDARRSSLATYLYMLVRRQVQRQRRTEARRPRITSLEDAGEIIDPRGSDPDWGLFLTELTPLLSRGERQFLCEHLLAEADSATRQPLAEAHVRKLRQRLLSKAHHILGDTRHGKKRP
jgi:DNA-directed RNA polymerase specialized sigma24 family protein